MTILEILLRILSLLSIVGFVWWIIRGVWEPQQLSRGEIVARLTELAAKRADRSKEFTELADMLADMDGVRIDSRYYVMRHVLRGETYRDGLLEALDRGGIRAASTYARIMRKE